MGNYGGNKKVDIFRKKVDMGKCGRDDSKQMMFLAFLKFFIVGNAKDFRRGAEKLGRNYNGKVGLLGVFRSDFELKSKGKYQKSRIIFYLCST